MAFQIQNLACFEVELNPNSHRFYFKEDAIPPDAIVENIILEFGHPHANTIYVSGNPFSLSVYDLNASITSSNSISDSGLYLNLSNGNTEIVSNCYFKQIQSIRGATSNVLFLNLNSKIYSKNCYFNYSVNNTVRLLCYITYRTKVLLPINPIFNGCFTVTIPLNTLTHFQDILLSDYIPSSYISTKIKKITTTSSYFYLYLKAGNNLIENIPASFLVGKFSKNEVLFDNLQIDYHQSLLKYRGYDSDNIKEITLTFYY